MKVRLANKIILNPYITEKTFELVETEKKICFIVEKTSTKSAIKDAINTLYEQKAVTVNTARTIYGKKAFVEFETVDIARDLASSGLGQLKKHSPIKINQKFKNPIKVSIKKEKGQGCGIFGSVYIKSVQNKESPDWLKKRIISLGLKPISAIVDATNYVMFDLNRPLHAYDADKIDQEIIVRNSKKGETFEALDNKKYALQNNMCAISDKSGVLGLGGIIGGIRSGTEFTTKNILLESAYFFPSPIRKTS